MSNALKFLSTNILVMRNKFVKKDEMGGACNTNGGKEECI
jgi:hypothetical protein